MTQEERENELITMTLSRSGKIITKATFADKITDAFLAGETILIRMGGFDKELKGCCRIVAQVEKETVDE
ncbi:MAG: hypothetical protein V3W41_22345 [Planctomycetota bacterium]